MSNFKNAILIAFLAIIFSTNAMAKVTFLPHVSDDLGFSGSEGIGQDHNSENSCSGFPLTSCPANGNCSQCSFGAFYKLNNCKSGFIPSGNSCTPGSCSGINASYQATIPVNNICTKTTANGLTCFKDCRAVSCSGYTLNCDAFNVANSASKDTCPDCSSADANCSPKLCKVGTCQDGYKLAENATQCIALDDTCSNGYFKTCETGTTGEPQYTEKGTACYKCKANDSLRLKYTINMSRTCPSGLTFDSKNSFEPSRPVSCTSEYCYEHDSPNYPYNYDGIHSNETESIVTEGTVVTITNIDPKITSIKSIATLKETPISGGSFTFTVNNLDVIRKTIGTDGTVGTDGTTGLGLYDFWTLQCEKQASLPILYSDLTISTDIIPGKTPIGIVFDESKKLAIGLKQAGKVWSNSNFDIPSLQNYGSVDAVLQDWAGRTNTKEILSYCKANSRSCPAAEYVNGYTTAGTHAGDWYFPASGELNDISNAYVVLNRSLSLVGGTQLVTTDYWSSSESGGEGQAWRQSLDSGLLSNSTYNSDSTSVRPVINYGDMAQVCSVSNCQTCISGSSSQCQTCNNGFYKLSPTYCSSCESGETTRYGCGGYGSNLQYLTCGGIEYCTSGPVNPQYSTCNYVNGGTGGWQPKYKCSSQYKYTTSNCIGTLGGSRCGWLYTSCSEVRPECR